MMGDHLQSLLAPEYLPPIVAGLSSPALRKAHAQRLLLFSLSLLVATACGWEVMMSSWTMRPGPIRIFRDVPSIMVVAACHGLAAFCRYLVSDTAASTKAFPGLGSVLATVTVHALVGLVMGFCAWDAFTSRAGSELAPKLKREVGALGSVMAGGALCGGWFALFLVAWPQKRADQAHFGVPGGTTLSAFLLGRVCASLEAGLQSGIAVSLVYLVLRFVRETMSSTTLGSMLSSVLGLPITHGATSADEIGCLLASYLVFLTAALNWCLHSFLSSIMTAIITAPQDFLLLWAAGEAAGNGGGKGGKAAMRPSCPAAMLLDAISVGHEAVLDMAERDFLQDRAGVGGYGGVGGGGAGGSTYKRGSMGDSDEEVELQRRALALTAMAGAGVTPSGSAGEAWGTVPTWARVARLQALQSLALKAPRNKELRAALYNINIAQVLRTLCLELDVTTLLLQSFAFRADPAATPRALACDGRTDIQWLVSQRRKAAAATGRGGARARGAGEGGSVTGAEPATVGAREIAGGRWLSTLQSGFTPPLKGVLVGVVLPTVAPLFRARANRGGGGGDERGRVGGDGGAGGGRVAEGRFQLSEIRVQSAIWAAESIGALMIFAPGESRMCSLDPMLPVVLGSFAGVLLAAQALVEWRKYVHCAWLDTRLFMSPCESMLLGERAVSSLRARAGVLIKGWAVGSTEDMEQLDSLARSLETVLSDVATKYRSCLSSFKFPLAYAETINRLCPP